MRIAAREVICSRPGQVPAPGRVSGVCAEFGPGPAALVFGPPGAGKSLLLRVLGLMERPDSGDVELDGQPTRALDEASRAGIRSQRFGYVFGAPHLLPSLNVIENIAVPLFKVHGVNPAEARERTEALLARAGIPGVSGKAPDALGRSESLRVALVRALVHGPDALLVELLGQDTDPGEQADFAALAAEMARGITMVVAASSDALAPLFARALRMEGGRILEDQKRENL